MIALEFMTAVSRGEIPDIDRADQYVEALIKIGMLEREDDGRVVLTDAGWSLVERAA